jgi:hypothetical protein
VQKFLSFSLIAKYKKIKIYRTINLLVCMGVKLGLSYSKVVPWTEGVQEMGAEENIWA